MADHRTPLLRNCWYVAGLSSEFSRELRERTLLDRTVVMFRRLDGEPVILQNRCVHRSFPLSRGRLEGDHVICGYHGMVYNPAGLCVGMPSLNRVPAQARLHSYPVIERPPLVWVWMGSPALADPADIIDTSWLASPRWTTVGGQFPIPTNYVAMHENLLDQTHFAVLHSDTVGTPAYAQSELKVHTIGNQIHLSRLLRQSPAPPVYDVPMQLSGRPVDRHSDSYFASPAAHIANARIVNAAAESQERREYCVNISHLFTPERQDSIHYWWFNSRDFRLDEQEASDYLFNASMKAYQEDVDALTWIQEIVARESGEFTEVSFAPDKPGVLMRRMLLKLSQTEAAF